MNITNLEASFYRYLYEKLTVAHGIPILERKNQRDFEGLTAWVVIESLTNPLGAQPKQLYFLHAAVQGGMKDENIALSRLVDKVLAAVEAWTRIDTYDYDTGLLTGEMEVSETSLSPTMPHASGGSFRSITVGVVYAGN